MDADLFGSVDSKAHLVATNIDDSHLDIVPDQDRLVALTGQHQHVGSFLGKGPESLSLRPAVFPRHPRRGASAGLIHYSPQIRSRCRKILQLPWVAAPSAGSPGNLF